MNVVNFCPECSGLLKIKKQDSKNILFCRCGYEREVKAEELEGVKVPESKKRDSYYLKYKYRRGF